MSGILAISSSPRRNGNSELALRSFCRAAEEKNIAVETVRLQKLNLEPCRGCERCAADGICVVQDGMQPLYDKVAAAKGLVLATPVYFGSISAQLKAFIDRFQCWWHAKYTLNKPFVRLSQNKAGYLICTGALHRPEFCDNVEAVGRVFYHSINYHFSGFLCLQGLEGRGQINGKPGALERAYKEGETYVERYIL